MRAEPKEEAHAAGVRATAIAIACVVYGASILLHEVGHLAAALLAGGRPELLTTTDVRGDWSDVSTAGIAAIGAAGSVVNVALALVGLAVLRGGAPRGGASALFGWLLFAVNGFLVAVYLAVSPLLGFGDWATVLARLGAGPAARAGAAAAGVGLTLLVFRRAARAARSLPRSRATGSAHALALTCWLSGGVMAGAAALLSPLAASWAVPIALGSTLGTTAPMLPAAAAADEAGRAGPAVPALPASLPWIGAGALVAAAFVLAFGPGVAL